MRKNLAAALVFGAATAGLIALVGLIWHVAPSRPEIPRAEARKWSRVSAVVVEPRRIVGVSDSDHQPVYAAKVSFRTPDGAHHVDDIVVGAVRPGDTVTVYINGDGVLWSDQQRRPDEGRSRTPVTAVLLTGVVLAMYVGTVAATANGWYWTRRRARHRS